MRFPHSFLAAALASILAAPNRVHSFGAPLDPYEFCRNLPTPTFSRHPNVAATLRRKEARRRARKARRA